jgi:hypothetical protein
MMRVVFHTPLSVSRSVKNGQELEAGYPSFPYGKKVENPKNRAS